MIKDFDVIILGTGAAGLMCASFLKEKNIAIIDHNPSIGAKIKISGGGKCNITNKRVSYKNYLGDSKFVQKILESFTNKDLLLWLKKRDCNPIIRKKTQYFCPKTSKEILDIFKKETSFATFFLNHEILDIEKENDFFIKTSKVNLTSKYLVVATGGLSYKKIGASSIGYDIAKSFGHTVTPLKPALVGLTVQKEQFWFKSLSGISFKATIKVNNKEFFDDILFTHKGISGPAILNASLYWEKGKIVIDFLNGKKLQTFLKNPHKQLISQLPFPKRFTKSFLESISLKDKKIKELKQDDFEKLKILENYPFSPAGTFGFERAEVTKGGVKTDEIDFDLMSKRVKNLFFIGEVLDVTGELGGYNFQWAFSSAVTAARSINDFSRSC